MLIRTVCRELSLGSAVSVRFIKLNISARDPQTITLKIQGSGCVQEYHSLGTEAVPKSGGTAAVTSVSYVRQQQVELTEVAVGVAF